MAFDVAAHGFALACRHDRPAAAAGLGRSLMPAKPWRIAMASVIGTSHLSRQQPCQDAHFHLSCRDHAGRDVTILVASDGAGFAAGAEIGASVACRTFAKLVLEFVMAGGDVGGITPALAKRWIAAVAYRLALDTIEEGRPYHDYACTLLGAIATDSHAAFVQLGDGAIVHSRSDDTGWQHVFWPQHGEFANTTNFVVGKNAIDSIDFKLLQQPVAEIALFTDGLENMLLRRAERAVHAPFFDSMFPAVRRSTAAGVDETLSLGLEKYLATEPVNARTDDDKTLILASRRT
jgi:hypothetical protein